MRSSWSKYGIVLSSACSLLLGCGETPSEPSNMVDNGSWYTTGFRWAHDGNPYESEHFVVFSDAAGLWAREYLADIGEELLTVLVEQFGLVGEEVLRFPPGQEKIHIFAYKNHAPTNWGGWAYYGGLLIYSADHEWRRQIGHTAPQMYIPVVKHELMHVLESLIKASGNPELVDVWLTEGIAEAVSGGTAGGAVTSRAKMADLIATYGDLNPIAMHQYRYPDIDGVAYNYYYPMFQLAATYLVDAKGHARAWRDLRDLLLDVRSGTPFATAFEDRFGIGLAQYEEEFFDRMNDYLP